MVSSTEFRDLSMDTSRRVESEMEHEMHRAFEKKKRLVHESNAFIVVSVANRVSSIGKSFLAKEPLFVGNSNQFGWENVATVMVARL